MKPIIFKGENNTRIKVSFNFILRDCFGALYQPSLSSSKGEEEVIPLSLSEKAIDLTKNKLNAINKKQDFPFEYLKNVVAGACSLSMKWGF